MDIKTDKNDNNNNNNINITYSIVGIICICIFASVISITAIIVIFPNIKFKVNNNNNNCDLVNVVTTTFWTDKNIDYWSNINIVRPSDDDNVTVWEMYRKQLYIQNEARLRALKCVPKEGVFKIETLISKEKVEKEKNNNATLIPHQKAMLRRCMPQYSYCEVRGTKCTPTEWKNKTIFAIFKLNNGSDNTMFDDYEDFNDDYEEIMNAAINGTLSKKMYIILTFLVEEHVHCSCLCKM